MSGAISVLYKHLLRGFDFSIGGYDNPELEISRFFNALANNAILVENRDITFLMSGYAKLDNGDGTNQELDLDSWKTSLLGRFNFYDYGEGYSENLLSAYLSVTNKLTSGKRATNIIADNVRSGYNLKVGIVRDSEHIVFRDNKRREYLEILVPSSIFRSGLNGASLRNLLAENPDTERRVVQSLTHKHEYLVQSSTSVEGGFVEKLFSDDFALSSDGVKKLIRLSEGRIDQVRTTLNNPKADVSEIAAVAIGASLFCLHFDSSVEFFVSTSHLSRGQRFSLGSIAVGVKESALLNDDEHAMFNILSNHLAANLSAQLVHDTNQASQLRLQRRLQVSLLRNLMTEVVIDEGGLDHFARAVSEDDVARWHVYKEQHGRDLMQVGLKSLVSLMDRTFLPNQKVGKGMYSCFHSSAMLLEEYRARECFFYTEHATPVLTVPADGTNNEPLVNVALFNELMRVISKPQECKSLRPTFEQDKILVEVIFNGRVSLGKLLRSMMRNKDGSETAGSLGAFFISNYWDILISGNLEIGEMQDSVFTPLICFEGDLIPVFTSDRKVASLRHKNLEPDEMKEYSSLVYRITFKSI